MTVIYSMKITQLDTVPQDGDVQNFVIRAHWAYTGELDDKTAGFGGTSSFTYDPDNPFINYNDLTNEIVSEWVIGSWSPEYKEMIESIIMNQLAAPADPLPWQEEIVASPEQTV